MSALYEIQLPVFEGPLDLLLQLIEREELDITTVALAHVTDQYLEHLKTLENRTAADLAGFLVVAARLLLIKSEALLPRSPGMPIEADDIGQELVDRLEAYRQYKQAAALLDERENQALRGYVRIAPTTRADPTLDLSDVSVDDLLAAVVEALGVQDGPPVEEVVKSVLVTIEEQIRCILRHLDRTGHVCFRTVLTDIRDRYEIIVTLLAMLELIKQDVLTVTQDRLFGEILMNHQAPEPSESEAVAPPPTTSQA